MTTWEQIGRRIRGKNTLEAIGAAWRYLRGYLVSFRFENRSFLSSRGKIKVLRRNGTISVGSFTEFWPGVKLSCWGADGEKRAVLKIGQNCSIGDRTEIHSGKRVEIGDRVIIAWDCVIMDRDYHSTEQGVEEREPVIIGEKAWIGCRAIILKGVTIGEGAVVAAGSVVTKDVGPYSLVAGNPARFIRKVEGWR